MKVKKSEGVKAPLFDLDELKNFNVGEIIKRLRKANKLSRKELAELSGLSPAAIYKIEANQMVPTVITLIKIARALKKNIQEILDLNVTNSFAIIRKKNRLKFNSPEFPVTVDRVSGELSGRNLEAGIITLKKGSTVSRKPMKHTGEELHLILKGKVQYQINEEKFVLQKGDSVHFHANNPHTWENVGEGDAEVLVIITPSPFV